MNKIFFCIVLICALVTSSCGGRGGSATVVEEACCEMDLGLKLWAELDLTAAPNTLASSERQAGWQLLFDGVSFNGWHGYNTPGRIPGDWAIEDGTLTVNGTGGGEEHDIITDGIYGDFAFSVEYMLTPGANSGIIYHVKEDPMYGFPYETGPEFQLADDSNRPIERRLQGVQSHGADYAMYAPISPLPANPANEWNRMMLIVKDNEVIHIMNGVEIVRFVRRSDEWNELRNSGKWDDFPDYAKYDEGHISLQNHGHKLWFRNVKIKNF